MGLCCCFRVDNAGEGVRVPPDLRDLGLRPHLTAAPVPSPHQTLHPTQEDSDGSIECVNEERRLHKKVCNVSYPFFRAKAKVEPGGRLGRQQGGYWEAGRVVPGEMEVSRKEGW